MTPEAAVRTLSNRLAVVRSYLAEVRGLFRIRRRKKISRQLASLIVCLDNTKRFPSDESFAELMKLVSDSYEEWFTKNGGTVRDWVESWKREALWAPKSQAEYLIELSCVLGEPEAARVFLRSREKSWLLSLALNLPGLSPRGWRLEPIRRLWVEKGRGFNREEYPPMEVYEGGRKGKRRLNEGPLGFLTEPTTVGPVLLNAFGLIRDSCGVVLSDPGADTSQQGSGLERFVRGSEFNTNRALLSDKAFRGRPSYHLKRAVDLTGRYSSNYWHAMIEYLPRLMSVGRDSSIPAIASAEMQPAAKRALEILLGSSRVALYLSSSKHALVENLHVPRFSTKVIGSPVMPIDAGSAYELEPLKWLKETLVRELSHTPPGPRKIFIERRGGSRTPTNWAEARGMLQSAGFTGVDLAGLSLEEQIGLFSNASEIVGIGGAQWANLLFCKPGTKVISLTPSLMVFWPLHYQIANDFGLEFVSLSCKQTRTLDDTPNLALFLHGDFFIELTELEQALQETFGEFV